MREWFNAQSPLMIMICVAISGLLALAIGELGCHLGFCNHHMVGLLGLSFVSLGILAWPVITAIMIFYPQLYRSSQHPNHGGKCPSSQ